MSSNALWDKPTVLDTGKLVAALMKLGLSLYGGPSAIAMGEFLSKCVLTGLEGWEASPAAASAPAASAPEPGTPQPAQPAAHDPITIAEVLAHFGISTIEIGRDGLRRLLESHQWTSEKGGISLLARNEPLTLARWFPPRVFPNALHDARVRLDDSAGHEQLAASFPHVSTADMLCLPAHPDATLEHTLVSRMAPGVQVVFKAECLADATDCLVEHGIRLSPGPALRGFRVSFAARTGSLHIDHRHLLIASSDLPREDAA